MGADRIRKSLKVVTALQHRHQPAVAVLLRRFHQFACHPGEIVGRHAQRTERIALMSIEAGRDDDELGSECVERGQNPVLECLAQFHATVACSERRVEDVAHPGFADRAGAREQRHLMRTGVENARIGVEDLLRAVAVVDVEIDDRDPLQPVITLRVSRADTDVVEQAEPHGPFGFGVVARRAARDEGVLHLIVEHLVNGLHRRTDAAQHDLPRRGLHHGVAAVEIDITGVRAGGFEPVDVAVGVHVARRIEIGDVGLLAHQRVELGPAEHRFHNAVAVGPLRMAVRGLVIGEARMVQKQGCHGESLPSDTVCKSSARTRPYYSSLGISTRRTTPSNASAASISPRVMPRMNSTVSRYGWLRDASATSRSAGLALNATPRPAAASMSMSLAPSPTATVCAIGTPACCAKSLSALAFPGRSMIDPTTRPVSFPSTISSSLAATKSICSSCASGSMT